MTQTLPLQEKARLYRGRLRRHDPGKAAAIVYRRTRLLLERRTDLAYTVPTVEVERDSGLREIRVYVWWDEAALPEGTGVYIVPPAAYNIELPASGTAAP